MAIHEAIKAEIPAALKERNEVRLRTLRSLATAMTNEVVAKKRKPDEFLTDDEALAVLTRAKNQRKDSIEQFTNAGRTELAEPEQAELSIIESLLPAQMSAEEVMAAAQAKQQALGITDKKDAGRLMGALMQEVKGKADGTAVKAAVDALLS